MQASRAAKVSEEHKAESAALKELWERTGHGGLTQDEFGQRFEIGSQAAVGFFLNGKSPISLKAARGFAKGLNCEIAEFSARLAAEAAKNAEFAPRAEDFVPVKRVNAVLAAGAGQEPAIEDVVGELQFTKHFLRSCGVSAGSARVVDVKGPSMEPTIRDGAVLLVSLNNREPVNNAVFALSRPVEGLIVKRLIRVAKDTWVARSDNREFLDIPIGHGEPISIIGRAHWMGVKL